MKSKGWVLAVLTFTISVQLLGCTPIPETSETEVITASPVSSIDEATTTPSNTIEADASDTPEATVQETTSPTSTLSPTPTNTATVTPTFTPLPTLDPTSAQNFVLELLQTNGGCKFPCWWGLTPGKTSWEEAKHFLTSFADSIWPINDSAPLYETKFSVPEAIDDDGIATIVFELDEQRIVEIIRAGKVYPINEFLADFGQPDQIYIWAISAYTLDPEARFTVALYYISKGIMVAYYGTAAKAETLQICPSNINEKDTYFWFWDPASGKTFEDIGDPILFQYDLIFNPLADIANIDVPLFSETYSLSENLDQCFEMPDPDL